jgi:maleate isomerase
MGWRAKIGVLVPHADVNPDGELNAMAPDGVSFHCTRVPFGAMRAGGEMDATIALASERPVGVSTQRVK